MRYEAAKLAANGIPGPKVRVLDQVGQVIDRVFACDTETGTVELWRTRQDARGGVHILGRYSPVDGGLELRTIACNFDVLHRPTGKLLHSVRWKGGKVFVEDFPLPTRKGG